MKDSEILRKAREMIASNRQTYICYAIWAVRLRNPSNQKQKLCDWVHVMLRGDATYSGWIYTHYPRKATKMDFVQYREGRLQWLDWMIAECEKAEAKEGERNGSTS